MRTPNPLLLIVALCLLGALAPASARAVDAPSGMFGMSDYKDPEAHVLAREGGAGLRAWRMPLNFGSTGSVQGRYQWAHTDNVVASAARNDVTMLFVLTGCPAWSCPAGGLPTSGPSLQHWKDWVAAAVDRYGHGGAYWAANPGVPYRPVTHWQVMNEVNGATAWPNPSAAAYAAFLRETSPVIRGADANARVVLAGLPEKMTIWMKDYLPALYAQPGFRESVDVIAVHGYAPDPAATLRVLDLARYITMSNGDSAKPLWITEMGWATAGPPHPFTVTEAGQAQHLQDSFDRMVACRSRWNLDRVYWFGYQDRTAPAGEVDYWGNHKGLYRPDGTTKPSLASFREFTAAAPLPDRPGNASCDRDTVAPQTTISSGPDPRVAEQRPTFAFASDESGVTYECHYAGSPWERCTPDAAGVFRPLATLAAGTQTLEVRATDRSGNVDATPARWSFIVDRTPPDTYIAGVTGNVSSPAVLLLFGSNEPTSRYECQVDTDAWSTCANPFRTTLSLGTHTIRVRAVDLAGWVDPAPAQPWFNVRY